MRSNASIINKVKWLMPSFRNIKNCNNYSTEAKVHNFLENPSPFPRVHWLACSRWKLCTKNALELPIRKLLAIQYGIFVPTLNWGKKSCKHSLCISSVQDTVLSILHISTYVSLTTAYVTDEKTEAQRG